MQILLKDGKGEYCLRDENSSTLCQYYIFQAFHPLLNDPPVTYIPYMDDILLAYYDSNKLGEVFQLAMRSLNNRGLRVASDKNTVNLDF